MSVLSLDEWRKKLEERSTYQSQSTQSTPGEQPGLIATNEELFLQLPMMASVYTVLHNTWRSPYTTKSDFARAHANYVAMCASEDLITTKIAEDTWGNEWLITEMGMAFMQELQFTLERMSNELGIDFPTPEADPTD
jgi:hypothetical protein